MLWTQASNFGRNLDSWFEDNVRNSEQHKKYHSPEYGFKSSVWRRNLESFTHLEFPIVLSVTTSYTL